MKKKLLIGALGLASMFAISYFDGEGDETERRPIFSSEITGYGPCYYTGELQADGTPVTVQEVETTTLCILGWFS